MLRIESALNVCGTVHGMVQDETEVGFENGGMGTFKVSEYEVELGGCGL
jgi:hypothetical protein